MPEKKPFRFLDWKVYNDAQKLFSELLVIVRQLPNDTRHSLGNQIVRSASSIILNIAEGSGRGTDKELNRFFNMAIGSANETVAVIDSLARNKHLSGAVADKLFCNLEEISRQLGGFKKKL